MKFVAFVIMITVSVGCGNKEKFKSGGANAQPTAIPPKEEKVEVKEPAATEPETVAVAPTPVPPQDEAETFDLAKIKQVGKIDLVLVVDNSGSMNEEAEQVRRNIRAFMAGLKERADIKLALLSSRTNGALVSTGVDLLPAELDAGHVQLPINVGSTNALAIAAAASCPAATTDVFDPSSMIPLSSYKVCNRSVTFAAPNFLEAPGIVLGARGQLTSFFRGDAKRVYVFVTDDNTSFVTESNFTALMAASAKDRPYVFAFRGVTSRPPLCAVARPGTSYEALATETGGEVFDICETDWSANFAKLSKRVVRIANTSFDLKSPNILSVLYVKVDGKEIAKDLYKIEGQKLIIQETAFTADSLTVEIAYKYKK